jgi:hypothetical protein
LIARIRQRRFKAARQDSALAVEWSLDDGATLRLQANPSAHAAARLLERPGREIFRTQAPECDALTATQLAPWSVAWTVEDARAAG